MKNILVPIVLGLMIAVDAQPFSKDYVNPTPGYSNAVVVTNGNVKTIYVAGQVGHGQTLEEHYKTSFLGVLKQLKDAGASFSDVVKMTIYIDDYRPRHLDIISKVRMEIFGEGNMPAITMVGVEELALRSMRVETEAMAIVEIKEMIGQDVKLLSADELRQAKVFKSIESTQGMEDSVYVLDFSGTELTKIPDQVFRLDNLQSLNLSNTGVSVISEKISQLKKLQKLNVDHLESPNQNLNALPKGIMELQNLEEININGNPNLDLEKVFDQLASFSSLKILAVMNNNIVRLPENVKNLKSIEQVWIGQNKDLNISLALDDLKKLPNLKHLGFGGIGIETLTFKEGSFQNLENVWLAGNRLTSIPGVEKLSKVKSISLNNNGLKELPNQIFLCENLESLSLNNNPELNVDELAKNLVSLQMLRVLSLNNNDMETIPDVIGKVKSLQYLVVRGNEIPEKDVNRFQVLFPSIKIIQ
ncbi:leucine-rich repeat domain-containing protein [Ekhidna sp.]|uniref:leucine-rich repeat domain-containing protein n=1 Tax=Ekhidna sp. TaxID=2608089 RepID=UPI0032980FDC